jgi:hypothetical protein
MTKNQLKKIIRECLSETLNENIPTGKSKVAQDASKTLNFIVNRIQSPDLGNEARSAAAKIIDLIDQDQSR